MVTDPPIHLQTDRTNYNTLRRSLARSVINQFQAMFSGYAVLSFIITTARFCPLESSTEEAAKQHVPKGCEKDAERFRHWLVTSSFHIVSSHFTSDLLESQEKSGAGTYAYISEVLPSQYSGTGAGNTDSGS